MVQSAAAVELVMDKDASKITFVGSKKDGKHEGGFKKFDAKAVADFENPENGSLTILIDTPSLWSDNEKLTNHLKNPDFFDVRKYKNIKFESTKITHSDDPGTATITGKMTMLDKTVEVEIPVKVTKTDSTIQLDADFKIDRTKWGMTYGEGQVNNDVQIKALLVFKL
jgi:polyisoprenoid-binding protein YceI